MKLIQGAFWFSSTTFSLLLLFNQPLSRAAMGYYPLLLSIPVSVVGLIVEDNKKKDQEDLEMD